MWRVLIVVLAILVLPAHAQISNAPLNPNTVPPVDIARFPTYAYWQSSVVPVANRVDIAQRLLGYQPTVMRDAPPQRAIGELAKFSVVDTAQLKTSEVDAELWAIGQYAYVWVEVGSRVDASAMQAFVTAFDALVYHQVRDLWGSEPAPPSDIDNDPRIYMLFARGVNPEVSGYFTSQHTYPREIVKGSNEHEMIIFNLGVFENILNSTRAYSVASHEFQHMIRHAVDLNESAWVDEGFSVFTEKYLGLDDNRLMVQEFMNAPDTQLTNWSNRLSSYGASLLFLEYLYERLGIDALKALSTEPADGLAGFDRVLVGAGQAGVDSFFADWVLANLIRDPQTGYGYSYQWAELPPVATVANVTSYPYSNVAECNQYGTHYYELTNLNGVSRLTLDLQKPTEVGLLPPPPAGPWHVYSNLGDESNMRLTRQFDLTGVANARLLFRTWYNLETNWDYFYVSISTDGVNWTLQNTATGATASENPYDRAYGAGYTGPSVNWIGDMVDLTPYAGQQIWVRFEVITDDAKTLTGVALDDIAIPEIGYLADFEGGNDGGWQLEGWLLSDNRLPQRTWVQAVQYVGGQPIVTRWLAETGGQFTLELVSGVEKVYIALSPFAPLTTVPMGYMLTVTPS